MASEKVVSEALSLAHNYPASSRAPQPQFACAVAPRRLAGTQIRLPAKNISYLIFSTCFQAVAFIC